MKSLKLFFSFLASIWAVLATAAWLIFDPMPKNWVFGTGAIAFIASMVWSVYALMVIEIEK